MSAFDRSIRLEVARGRRPRRSREALVECHAVGPLGSKNKPKPPKLPKPEAPALPAVQDMKLSYTEASTAAKETQDTTPVSKAWLRRMICRAQIAVLDGIITDSQAVPVLADTLLGLRQVRAHYAQLLDEAPATAEPGDLGVIMSRRADSHGMTLFDSAPLPRARWCPLSNRTLRLPRSWNRSRKVRR